MNWKNKLKNKKQNLAKAKEEYNKYKDVPLPELEQEFILKSSPAHKLIKVKVVRYSDTQGLVETVHSGQQKWRTHHWIRKNLS